MHKYLIIKTSSIGDVIQSFPVVDYLKRAVPGCRIDWVVEKGIAPLLEAHPNINQVIQVDTKLWRGSYFGHRHLIGSFRKELRQKNYDALFDLQGNTKSGVITALAKAHKKVGFSWKGVAEKPNYFFTNIHSMIETQIDARIKYLQLVQEFIGDKDPVEKIDLKLALEPNEENRLSRFLQLGFQRPRLMICFGSNWHNKQLKETTLKEFLRLIHERIYPHFFFIFGNEKEKKLADELERIYSRNSQSLGNMSLALWQRFMAEVEGVITMDSAALHLCGTTSTPSFSLFGPSSALAYKPPGEKHRAFQGKCPYGVHFDKRCPHLRTCETGACLHDTAARELFRQFHSFWMSVSKSTLASTT